MTGRISRIRKYMLFFLKICPFFWKIIENVFGKKFDFSLAILIFLMEALDEQQNFITIQFNSLFQTKVHAHVHNIQNKIQCHFPLNTDKKVNIIQFKDWF